MIIFNEFQDSALLIHRGCVVLLEVEYDTIHYPFAANREDSQTARRGEKAKQ